MARCSTTRDLQPRRCGTQFLVMDMDPFTTTPAESVVSYGVDTTTHGEQFPDLRITADTSCAVWWTQFGTALKHACTGLMSNNTAMKLARVSASTAKPC